MHHTSTAPTNHYPLPEPPSSRRTVGPQKVDHRAGGGAGAGDGIAV